jgi:hypothetical protein
MFASHGQAVIAGMPIPTHHRSTRGATASRWTYRLLPLLGGIAGVILLPERSARAKPTRHAVGSVFVIAMENHNFTQPDPTTSPQQILNNPAAPYINSLITPGHPNAAHVSYATAYDNAGARVHPSEPNYVWAEAGTDFGVHTDADPRATNNNIFTAEHLTGQLDAAGIAWRNYQEDVQLTSSPTTSASGTNGPVNPYNGTTQFNYAVKHNPMAFFPDTALENVFPLSQLFSDLHGGTVGRYNWITPNQFNDAHSALTGGFTYRGTQFTGDQASIAQGDNFLSQIIPQIMATPEYKNNGVIIIWWDETERGDDAGRTIPEIVISPLAKGNAYASSVPLSHSSDLKTMDELFGLPFLNNPIPAAETNAAGDAQNNVFTANDLSDLFVPGVIPAPPSLRVTHERAELHRHTQQVTQVVRITNVGTSPVVGPLFLVLDNLGPNVSLLDADGVSTALAPLGSPFVQVDLGDDGDDDGDDNVLRPHRTRTVRLRFSDPARAAVTYDARALPVTPAP